MVGRGGLRNLSVFHLFQTDLDRAGLLCQAAPSGEVSLWALGKTSTWMAEGRLLTLIGKEFENRLKECR